MYLSNIAVNKHTDFGSPYKPVLVYRKSTSCSKADDWELHFCTLLLWKATEKEVVELLLSNIVTNKQTAFSSYDKPASVYQKLMSWSEAGNWESDFRTLLLWKQRKRSAWKANRYLGRKAEFRFEEKQTVPNVPRHNNDESVVCGRWLSLSVAKNGQRNQSL